MRNATLAVWIVSLLTPWLTTPALSASHSYGRQSHSTGSSSIAVSDSLSDVLPLAIGNTWTYSFNTAYAVPVMYERFEVGTTEYMVLGDTLDTTSRTWHFIERRAFTRSEFTGGWQYYSIQDSALFDIVESLQGRHALQSPSFNMYRALSFEASFVDSITFYRYRVTDNSGRGVQNIVYPDPSNPGPDWGYHETLVVSKDSGIVQTSASQRFGFAASMSMSYFLEQCKQPLTAIDRENLQSPAGTALLQNFPNPFNPSTLISYNLAHRSEVSLTLFNMLGQKVAVLISGTQDAGSHEVRLDGSGLASGVYIYRLQADDFVASRRLVLLR